MTVKQCMKKIKSIWWNRKDDKTTSQQSDDQKSLNKQCISDNWHFLKIDIFSSVINDKWKANKQLFFCL